MTWDGFLCDGYNNLFTTGNPNLHYDICPMDTGHTAFVCEYYCNELTRILFFISPCLTQNTTNDVGTLFISQKYSNVNFLPCATADLLVNAAMFRSAALQNAQQSLPYLLANFGYPAQFLAHALNFTMHQQVTAVMPMPPKVPELKEENPQAIMPEPVLVTAPVTVEIKPIIQKATTPEPVKEVIIPPVIKPLPVLPINENESDDESEVSIQSEVQAVAVKTKKKKKKKKIADVRENIAVKPIPAPGFFTWAYDSLKNVKQSSSAYINSIDERKIKTTIKYSTLTALNYVTLQLSETAGLIDREELLNLGRSRITPGAVTTAFLMFCATGAYLHAARRLEVQQQHPMAKAALNQTQRLKKG